MVRHHGDETGQHHNDINAAHHLLPLRMILSEPKVRASENRFPPFGIMR